MRMLTAAGARNVEQGSFGYYDVESLIAASPDALIYGDDYDGTTSLRADQDQHPALMKRYAGTRISYPAALYGCGVPQSADAAVRSARKDAAMRTQGRSNEPVEPVAACC